MTHGLFCRLFLTRFYHWPVSFEHHMHVTNIWASHVQQCPLDSATVFMHDFKSQNCKNGKTGFKEKKYFKLKNWWGCCHSSNYLLSSLATQDTTTCQKNATTYRKYEHTQFHSSMGTQTQTVDCAYIYLTLNQVVMKAQEELMSS